MIKVNHGKSIKRAFSNMILFSIAIDVIVIVFGIVMLFNPDFSNKMIGVMVGTLMIFSSISLLYNYFFRDGAKLYSLNLMFGILVGVVGLLLIVYPYSIINFVTVCLGIYFLITGAVKLNYAFWLKKGGESAWTVVFVNSIVLEVLGLIMLFNPFSNLAVTQVIGIFLILSSIIKIADTVLFRNKTKEIMKIFW